MSTLEDGHTPGYSNSWKKYFSLQDIRFWLMIFFVIRLYAITMPPLEFQHAWRQADGLMIARNFFEIDSNIFYPRVDTAGEKTGITGSEFPILNYIMYVFSVLFGYQDWYGRLIVLIVSTLGCYFFYRSIRNYFGETTAFTSTIILTCSYWFSYSRKTFPDCFSAGLCLIALFCVLEYLEKGKLHLLVLYAILGALGGLSKISSTILLAVLAFPVFFRQYPVNRKLMTMAASAVILCSIGLWYFYWVPYLNETFGYGKHFTTGCPLFSMGWEEISQHWQRVLWRLYIVPVKYTGFFLFVAAVVYVLIKRKWLEFGMFILPYIFFLVIILKTGKNIISDQYYVLAIIPAIAFLSGFVLSEIKNKKIVYVLLTAIVLENIIDQSYDFREHRINSHYKGLESVVDKYTKRDDLFLINSGQFCPTVMYFAHRRGWTTDNTYLQDQQFLKRIAEQGCKYVLVVKHMYGESKDIELQMPLLYESDDFRLYALELTH